MVFPPRQTLPLSFKSTIFKTITDEATGNTKIVNSLFEQIKKIKEVGIKGWLNTSDIDLDLIDDYNKAIETSTDKQATMAQYTSNTNKATAELINSTKGAVVSEKAKTAALNASTVAAKASALATKALQVTLSSLASIGIGMAINGIITLITELVNAEKKAKQQAIENAKAYENQKTELESLKQQYIEIMDSEKSEAEKAKELDSIKQTLAETYGVEKEALDKLNESRKEGLELMEQESVQNAQQTINKNQADYNKYSKEAMDAEINKSSWYKSDSNKPSYKEQEEQEQNVLKFLEQYGIGAEVEKGDGNIVHRFAFEYGESAYAAYENINEVLSELSIKEQKEGLNPIERVVINQLRVDSDKLKKYLYDSDTGIDNIMSSTADAYWATFKYSFEKESNNAFDNIDTLDGLEQWEKGFIKSLGEFANDPYFSQYIEKIFGDKKEEIQKATNQTEQSIKFPTVSVTEFNEELEKTSEKLEKITTSASKVQSALKSAFSKENFSVDDVLELIELIPDIADKFKMNDDGTFSIDYKDLQSGAESYIATQKEEIDTTNELIKTKISELEVNIALNKSKLPTNINSKSDYEYYQGLKNAIETDESNLSDLKAQLSEGLIKSEFLAKSAEDLSSSFSAVVDVLINRYEVIVDVEDTIAENGSISLDTLNKIKEVYPELSNEVSNYMMGLIDEQSLLNKLKDTYDDDFYEYRDAIAQKIDLTDEELQSYLNALNTKYAEDSDYYTHLGATSENFVNYMKDNYDVDLENFETWLDAKSKMHDAYISRIETAGLGLNIEDYYDFDNAKWKDGAEQQLAQIQMNSPKEFSEVMSRVYAVLDDYGQGMKEFGKLFKSANTLDGISGKASTSSSSTSSSSKDTSSSFFDWVQVRLEKLKTITSNFIDGITETISKKQSEVYLNKAVKAVRNEKVANQKAVQTYTAAANKIGLSSTWQKKVQNGSYSLDDITDSDLAEKIQKYQEFWDKIEDCKQNIKDLIQQEQELIIQTEDLNLDDYEYKANRKNYAVGVAEGKITTKDLQGKRVTTKDYETVNKALTAENTAIKSQIRYASMIQSKYDPTSDRYRELQEIIESGKQTLQDNTDAILENNKKISDLKIADYSNQAHTYNRKVELGQTRISLAQAEGKKIKSSSYQYLIDNTEKENEALRQQRAYIQKLQAETQKYSELWSEYQSQLEEINDTLYNNRIQQAEWNAEIRNIPMAQLKSTLEMADSYLETFKSYASMMEYVHGKSNITAEMINNQKWSDEAFEKQVELFKDYWNEYISAMGEGRAADAEKYFKLYSEEYQTYNDMLITNEELNRQARDIILYRNYENDLEHIEDVKKAISSLEDILNDDALFNDDGSFSKQGVAKIALTINQLEQARASVENYQKQIDVLNANRNQYKSEDEFNEKLRELTEGYQNATAEVNQYTEAIKDLYKNQAQEELNMLNELIDLRQKALEKKKSYYDYDRTIRDKTKDITAMQMQIEALNGVSTAEAKAQKALLQEQLNDLEEDLADTQAEHIYQVQIDGLNEQKEILQDIYDTFVDSLNECLDAEEEIISSASYLAVNSVQAVNDLLKEIANSRGYDIDYIGDVLPHFADGGLVKSKGKDDGLAWLKAGEYVLNENAYKAFKYSVPTIDSAAQKMTQLLDKIDNGSTGQSLNVGDINLIVQGNVDQNVIADLKKYQKQLTDSVISTITKDLIKTGYKR